MENLLRIICAVFLVATIQADPASQSNRIHNGQVASAGQFPYAAAIIPVVPVTGRPVCGGSLVSPRFVLTAGRCVYGVTRAYVVLGAVHVFEDREASRLQLDVTEFIVHSGFEAEPEVFDVALVRLPVNVPIGSAFIDVVRLPNRRQVEATFVGQQATVFGWGSTGPGSEFTNELRFIRAQVISQLSCTVNLPTNTILGEHICMDGANNSPCAGDYGGPLTITDVDGQTTQIGVFSFTSVLGCTLGRPSVYTRMSSYLDWIGQNSDVVIRDDFN
nr:collagenase-like [Aedes albopictus]